MHSSDLNSVGPVSYSELECRRIDWRGYINCSGGWAYELMGNVRGDVCELPILSVDSIAHQSAVTCEGPECNSHCLSGETKFQSRSSASWSATECFSSIRLPQNHET
jgi:hypothetical protein